VHGRSRTRRHRSTEVGREHRSVKGAAVLTRIFCFSVVPSSSTARFCSANCASQTIPSTCICRRFCLYD
jgi:hypothetical protein